MRVLISYALSVRHFTPSYLMLTIVVDIGSLQAFSFSSICLCCSSVIFGELRPQQE